MKHIALKFISAVLLSMTATSLFAWQSLDRNVDIECLQSTGMSRINCDYRLIGTPGPVTVKAQLEDQPLQLKEEKWPWQNARTAVLFLIDTSDPAREKVVKQNILHLQQLLQSLTGPHVAGLATFDKDLRLLAPLGSSKDEILDATGQVRAIGKTTELYRNLINAIETMARTQADRRIIFLFSDGLAEDKAYFHSDVIDSARKHKVVINSLGYPRSVSLSVALQIIRRISEETGGRYVEIDNGYDLPADLLQDPLQAVDNGGRFSINLQDISYVGIPENTGIQLNFSSTSGTFSIKLPVQRPAAKKPTVTEPGPAAVTMPAPAPQPAVQPQAVKVQPQIPAITPPPTQQSENNLEKWFLYGIPIALVVLLLLTIASLIISFIKPRTPSLPQVQMGDIKPYAYLVTQDDSQRRYPITRTTWRIGRSRENELSLDDNSISRRHAEIHRNTGDDFTIIDLDSLNGIFINSEKVKIHQLKEGDIVEIGDLIFRFTLFGADHALEESTVMQKTKTPSYTH